ncbi:substrate-binding domain-containing protein [Labrys monachus]|uniref:Ribose transport system substrate-binding protein n=1 Tax=Labrys monachus TaxID=217067 RepID=A0ABU0FC96_9HYPH|nr:substrate-binding domain-containing protein [Labrys monachus]MDQ0391754.1 ribose transport system substrate-binding protein [Labrys monachus]
MEREVVGIMRDHDDRGRSMAPDGTELGPRGEAANSPAAPQAQSPAAEAAGASRVPALSRAAALLDVVSTAEKGCTLSELARLLAAPKSSLLNICDTLVGERLLRKDATGHYRIGIRMAEFAAAQLSHPPRLKTLGVVVQNFTNPFFRVEADAITVAAERMGVAVTVLDAEQMLDRQLLQLESLAAQGVDAVIIDPVDSEAVATGVAAVVRRGIPVIAVNAGASGADAMVATDNVQAGELIGRHLGAALHGKGDVVVIGGTRITGNVDRIGGFLGALREYPEIRVVDRLDGDNTFERGRKLAHTILDRHPNVDAVFSINDPTALGVLETFEERHATVAVVSVDGSSSAVEALRSGRGIIATAAQNPQELGRAALRLADLLYSGGNMPRRTWLLPTALVTSSNADTYAPWDAPPT